MMHEDILPHSSRGHYTHGQQQSRRRRRLGSGVNGASCDGGTVRMCPHCGRTFKRTEHLERHVRTHTKEKPFICQCGAAFARRDLLTRHQRISAHDDDSPTDRPPVADASLASAVPLPSWSGDPWASEQLQLSHTKATQDIPNDQAQGNTGEYSEDMLSSQLFANDGGVIVASGAAHDAATHVLGDMDFDPHFREFANFLDGVGLPAEWSPYFNGPPDRDDDVVGTETRGTPEASDSPHLDPRQRPGTPFSSWLPSAPADNTIATYSPESRPPAVDAEAQPFKATDDQRARLISSLEPFADVLDEDFRFPSRHALTRYITSWFEGFHSHMPFIHCPTWNITDHPIELVLGIAAVGAQYCFEHKSSERLFFAGKTILLERLAATADRFGPRTSSSLALISPNSRRSTNSHIASLYFDPVEAIRTLIALMGFATWEPKPEMVREAFALQGLLAQVLRDIGLDEDDTSDKPSEQAKTSCTNRRNNSQTAWTAWVAEESRRRSKLIAFSFLHTHSVAYNVYPVLRSNEIKLRLPCSTKEWKAASATSWLAATKEVKKQQLYFLDALSLLLKNNGSSSNCAPLDPIPTPLGNYVLLHGLLQRIHIVRDLSLPVMGDSAELPSEEVTKLENGLRSWTSGWQQAAESSLDPNNENGPIPFTSSSLLALAYVRIHLHLGPYRQLETRDPACIAKAIGQSPNVERSDGVIAALLYAVHMLSIPVRLGVDRVARSQAFFWSVRHSLSSLECSILLSKWLTKLAETMASSPLSDSEDRILHWVRSVVEEAYAVVDFDDETDSSADLRDPGKLGLAVLRVWAHFFKSNAQWPFINILGRSLEQYCEMLQGTMAP